MEGSTKLSATTHPNTTAKCYRYFTQTAVKIFHEMDSPDMTCEATEVP